MPVDWNCPLETRDGRLGLLLPRDGWQVVKGDNRRRVLVCSFVAPRNETERESCTVWLYSEEGRCNTGGSDSPLDVHNPAVKRWPSDPPHHA